MLPRLFGDSSRLCGDSSMDESVAWAFSPGTQHVVAWDFVHPAYVALAGFAPLQQPHELG